MKKVVVGMSGGVDSSVAALLLKKQGYEVVGLHMKNNDSTELDADEIAIKSICDTIGIECHTMNYSSEMDFVKQYFIDEYSAGRTPNPCVMCNKVVKFKPFIDYAEKIGADFFATGHYCKIYRDGTYAHLLKAVDTSKDQTYFLNQLNQYQLSKALFPLGDMVKPDVRKLAEKNGLVTAHKKDSFDLCFLAYSVDVTLHVHLLPLGANDLLLFVPLENHFG